ncbi:MAG: adenosylcobinamide amidohydrolase [Deltaproteobacteria bacterium]|jgi:adenosylcobinamide amidohydrolase|nr:adenosylcobinamide amidohydrolase [Deltaproteobacteria bacterium]
MLLGRYYEGLELHSEDKMVLAKFISPHAVLSTSRALGGYREDLEYIFNHQACEPTGHGHGKTLRGFSDPLGYQADICAKRALPPDRCASLSTAANTRLVAVEAESFRDLTVVAAVTGGVEGNAGRAGDPATGHEGPNGYESLARAGAPGHGTINTLLFCNLPLTPGALVRAVMMATEAKTAALQERLVNSRYSPTLATGTGTDQIGVAAKAVADYPPLTSAGKHSKLGELIGRTVKTATQKVLVRQNGMTPDRQCSVKILLERFFERDGYYRASLREFAAFVAQRAEGEARKLIAENSRPLFHDPVTVAAVSAMVHLKDEFSWGILPPLTWNEVMATQAALVAAAVSGAYANIPLYREKFLELGAPPTDAGFLDLAARALVTGFADKWESDV